MTENNTANITNSETGNVNVGSTTTINHNENNKLDFNELTSKLNELLTVLKDKPERTIDEDIAIEEVAQAVKASENGDKGTVVKRLEAAGKWVLDTATKIGVDVVTDLIKKQSGM